MSASGMGIYATGLRTESVNVGFWPKADKTNGLSLHVLILHARPAKLFTSAKTVIKLQ